MKQESSVAPVAAYDWRDAWRDSRDPSQSEEQFITDTMLMTNEGLSAFEGDEQAVREHFTVENIQSFGSEFGRLSWTETDDEGEELEREYVLTQTDLDEMADLVIRNGWHKPEDEPVAGSNGGSEGRYERPAGTSTSTSVPSRSSNMKLVGTLDDEPISVPMVDETQRRDTKLAQYFEATEDMRREEDSLALFFSMFSDDEIAGIPASMGIGSDTKPATIMGVERFKSGARAGQVRCLRVRQDAKTRVDKTLTQGGTQTYEFARSSVPTGRGAGNEYVFYANAKGRLNEGKLTEWLENGEVVRGSEESSRRLYVGVRSAWSDPSF